MTRLVTWRAGLADLGPAVVAIGVFDGVHRGHQALISRAVADAGGRGLSAAVVTFEPDPACVVGPVCAARLLDPDDKVALIGRLGADIVAVVPFDADLAAWGPERFVDDVLVAALAPRLVVVGPDFRFGEHGSGDASTLREIGLRGGFRVDVIEALDDEGERISSTRIRALLAEGDVARAARLLGRPHRLRGRVRRGRGEGRSLLGIPTANIALGPNVALPQAGVYAAVATTPDGSRYPSAVSVGRPPMFPDARDVLEAHIVGFDGDLRGAPLLVEFMERIREQRTFPGVEELAEAMRADIRRAARLAV